MAPCPQTREANARKVIDVDRAAIAHALVIGNVAHER